MILLTALLLATSTASANTQQSLSNVGSTSSPTTARVTYPPKVMKLRRSTNMYRGWAGLNAKRVGQGPLTWLPLSDNLSKLQHQHDKAKKASRYWKAKYDRFIELRRATRRARHAAKHYAKLAHGQIAHAWRPLESTIKLVKHQYENALHAKRTWKHRWILSLRTKARLTPHQIVLVIRSYPWPHRRAITIARLESGFRYWVCNPTSPDHCGLFQESGTIRHRWGIGNGLNAGRNIWAAFKEYVLMHHSFSDWVLTDPG